MTGYDELNRSLKTSLDVAASMTGLVTMLGEVTIIKRAGDYIYRLRRTQAGVHIQIAAPGTRLGIILQEEEARLFKTSGLQAA